MKTRSAALVRVIALDIKKAFDRAWHRGLTSKLTSFGIQGDLHGWISSFLADRRNYVVSDGFTSLSVPLSAGVPQGRVINPLLYQAHFSMVSQSPRRLSA